MSITLAIPSKGRLKEKSLDVLERAGLSVVLPKDERSYRAHVKGDSKVDLGVTGEDLVRETLASADERVQIEARLGFGHADVVVAVPDVWYDVITMADLDDVAADFRQRHGRRLRIATKYWRLTQQFFSQMHGIQVYRIVESLGATEGAPASGAADIIVDITSTGSTLRANHLRILDDGVILRSEACLVSSRRSGQADAVSALSRRIQDALAKA